MHFLKFTKMYEIWVIYWVSLKIYGPYYIILNLIRFVKGCTTFSIQNVMLFHFKIVLNGRILEKWPKTAVFYVQLNWMEAWSNMGNIYIKFQINSFDSFWLILLVECSEIVYFYVGLIVPWSLRPVDHSKTLYDRCYYIYVAVF